METLVDCLPCAGTGKLTGFFDKTPKVCPWCESSGKVTCKENNTFLRVYAKLPAPSRACAAFGVRRF